MVPTPAGLQLFELLRGAAPALVDPGTTAIWEMRLDDVVLGKAGFLAVIDEIAAEAGRVIAILARHTGQRVELEKPAPFRAAQKRGWGRVRGDRKPSRKVTTATGDEAAAAKPKARRPRTAKAAKPALRQRQTAPRPPSREPTRSQPGEPRTVPANGSPPTEKMVAFAKRLATDKKAALPAGFDRDFEICRRFLDQHAGR